jgi:hypothetical protein
MEIGLTMMDTLEAIKGLDGYTETLVSLSTLLGAKMFEEKSDEHERLLVQIRENQKDGKWIVLEIMKDIQHIGTKADGPADVIGISAAIQRYVDADKQANEALKKADKANAPTPIADAVRQFRIKAGLASE